MYNSPSVGWRPIVRKSWAALVRVNAPAIVALAVGSLRKPKIACRARRIGDLVAAVGLALIAWA